MDISRYKYLIRYTYEFDPKSDFSICSSIVQKVLELSRNIELGFINNNLYFSGLAALFLYIINKYIKQLTAERVQLVSDHPPTYVECLINGTKPQIEEKKEAIVNVEDTNKPEVATS